MEFFRIDLIEPPRAHAPRPWEDSGGNFVCKEQKNANKLIEKATLMTPVEGNWRIIASCHCTPLCQSHRS